MIPASMIPASLPGEMTVLHPASATIEMNACRGVIMIKTSLPRCTLRFTSSLRV
jgi:hypothetical protein